MPSEHAKLSPSDSERWISCPAAIRVDESLREQGLLVDDESPYAREGTIAHALGEIEASHTFGLSTRKEYLAAKRAWTKEFEAEEYDPGTLEEMTGHVHAYVKLIAERLKRRPMSRVLLEQRMDTGVEKCWGTSDAVIVSPTHVEIIDFKYGAGVAVSAHRNSQLRLYGLGALDTFGDLLGETDLIVMTVHQPRAGSGEPSSEELPPDELRAWREGVVAPAAFKALHTDNAPFGPGEKACRWCPAAGTCRARIEKATQTDFGDILAEEAPQPAKPETLTPQEIGKALHRVGEIKAWCAALEAAALEVAYGQGQQIPGWKVVLSGGQRSIKDHAAAIQTLIDEGYNAEQVANPVKAKGIGDLEKLLGKPRFAEVLGPFIEKSKGREALVPEDDKREAISPAGEAAKDFEEEAA
jgi:RecB family exonuclease